MQDSHTNTSVEKSAIEEVQLQGGQPVRVYRAARADAPLIPIAPALGLRADYYAPLCQTLAAAGMHAVAIDLPGQGAHPLRASRRQNWGYAEVLEHLSRARETLCAQLGVSSCVWLGHSIGGQIALMDAGRAPDTVSAVVLVASGSPYYRAWNGVSALKILAGPTFGAAVASMVGHLPGERLGFGGREARRLIAEWAHLSRTGRYQCAGIDAEALLHACRVPVLALRLLGDPLAPEPAIEHTLRKLASREIDRVALKPSSPHNIHNRWPRAPDAVASEVHAFVTRLLMNRSQATPERRLLV